jgi:hypothetical protein
MTSDAMPEAPGCSLKKKRRHFLKKAAPLKQFFTAARALRDITQTLHLADQRQLLAGW